ncbi:ABC transporter substrate-binding protein [Roseibium sediminis]|uniref:ABC transporter substrate-binding protein n=1 Tax=Roseibium sediminis TaxID=1775174 RepID=UPI00123D324C|nr:extracellular solute-binding protein [Roseibium sediminis]
MPEIHLKGMTWDHSRGYDPMVATSAAFAKQYPGVSISWEKRSLQAFADRPVEEMANQYDLMVIDHPHVGEVARNGLLLPLNDQGRDNDLAVLAEQSVGGSHQSYEFDGQQWALAIDAATPVAAFRPDRLDHPPANWSEVVELAQEGCVGFALIPINALMTWFGLARSLGHSIAEGDSLIDPDAATHVLELMCEITALMNPRCLTLDPIGIYEWMGRSVDAPHYSPFGYGYTNYSRQGYCRFPLTFTDAPGIKNNGPRGTVLGGTGIAISAATKHPEVALNYAFWIASSECQKALFFQSGGQPANAAAWDDEHCNLASRNFFKNTRRTLDTSWIRPRYDGYMRFQETGGNIVHACLRGESSVKATADKLQAAYEESLS